MEDNIKPNEEADIYVSLAEVKTEFKVKMKRLEVVISSKENEILGLEERIKFGEELIKEYKNNRVRLQEKIDQLEKEKKNTTPAAGTTDIQVKKQIEKELSVLKIEFDKINYILKETEQKNITLQQTITNLENENKSLKQHIEDLEKSIKNERIILEENKNDNQSVLKTEYNKLKDYLEETEKKNKSLKESVAVFENENSVLKKQIETLENTAKNDLTGQKEKDETELINYRNQLTEKENQLKMLHNSFAEKENNYNVELEITKTKILGLQETITVLNTQITNEHKRFNDNMQSKESKIAEIDQHSKTKNSELLFLQEEIRKIDDIFEQERKNWRKKFETEGVNLH
ncbi:MAG: hypothetical protein A2252_00970 [Elusimicrobia bacterium RIFOXYA2_FULL_39_19]|nr:MAG: hypothetical protein A2252_00970 [Elusimicrobia bacterium RIFOXYA2_FULL_39_19]